MPGRMNLVKQRIGQICSLIEGLKDSPEKRKLLDILNEILEMKEIKDGLFLTKVTVALSLLEDLSDKFLSDRDALAKNKDEEIKQLSDQILKLADKLEGFLSNQHEFGFFEELYQDGDKKRVRVRARSEQLGITIDEKDKDLMAKINTAKPGQMVIYISVPTKNGTSKFLIDVLDLSDRVGQIYTVKDVLPNQRVVASDTNGHEQIVFCDLGGVKIEPGDKVLVVGGIFVTEKLAKTEVQELILKTDPSVSWSDLGGIDREISLFRKKVENPIVNPDVYKLYGIPGPKGILFYGPPGCGKTAMAKAAVNETAKILSEKLDRPIDGFYILVNGPADVLRSLVGDSPGRIQSIFSEAKRKAAQGCLVFIIFDEFESLFTVREKESYDAGVRKELVNQINAEMDGVDSVEGVLVIGLTNRPDLIDPAVIRPRRFDLKIRIPRPNKDGAAETFRKYLMKPGDMPLHEKYFDSLNYNDQGWYYPRDVSGERKTNGGLPERYHLKKDRALIIEHFVTKIVNTCYDVEKVQNRFFRVVYLDGSSGVFTYGDFMSGALIESIVITAKEIAAERLIAAKATNKEVDPKSVGLKLKDLYDAIDRVFRAERKLPTTTDALAEWLEIEGHNLNKRVERIIPLMGDSLESDSQTESRLGQTMA